MYMTMATMQRILRRLSDGLFESGLNLPLNNSKPSLGAHGSRQANVDTAVEKFLLGRHSSYAGCKIRPEYKPFEE
jgi:hypothetical protein